MKNYLKLSLVALALVLSTSPRAHAFDGNGWGWGPPPPPPPGHNKTAPEVDPSLALGGLTLLGGALTVLRARRRK